MSDKTKAVNLTENEISAVIQLHAMHLSRGDEADYPIDRMNYLNKRLKSFNQVEITADTDALNSANQQHKTDNATEKQGSTW